MDAPRVDDDDFLREWNIPEEDRARYTTQPWNGEYRWFRSPNVICLEHSRVLGGFAGRVGLSRKHAVGADVCRSQMLHPIPWPPAGDKPGDRSR